MGAPYLPENRWTRDMVSVLRPYLDWLHKQSGSAGPKGDTGPTGPQGPQGERGPAGVDGQAGAAGSQGPKGDPGDPASNLVTSVAGKQGIVTLSKSDVGLGNVDNTADSSKPISTATQTALNAKQDALGFSAVPNTRTVAGKALSADVTLAKADVGLGSVDNTSDAGKPISTATQTALNAKQDTSAKGQANGYASLDSGGKVPSAQLPASSGSDPWTVLAIGSDFSTTSATAVDVTGMAFTPSANTRYMFEAVLMLRTATATVNPRPGWAWPTGMTDGVAQIDTSQSATARLMTNGNTGAALLTAVGGLPNTTQSWPATVWGLALAGATPSGNLRIQIASETSGTSVTVKAGSYLRYRSY